MHARTDPEPETAPFRGETEDQNRWAEVARVRHAQLQAARAGRVVESAEHAARARELRERAEAWA